MLGTVCYLVLVAVHYQEELTAALVPVYDDVSVG